MSEYGDETSLEEILELLGMYCQNSGMSNVNIKIILPKQALDRHNLRLQSKKQVVLTGPVDTVGRYPLRSWNFCSIVELYSDDEHEVTKKP